MDSLRNSLDSFLYNNDASYTWMIEWAEKKTGLPRSKLAPALGVITALYLVFGYGGQLVCNAIGFAYPAYASMKALESEQKEDDTQWLTYWVIFALFSVVEFFANFIVQWVPIYWLLKCVFLVWCFLPIRNNGSVYLYRKYIRPCFLNNQGRVDNLINDMANEAKNRLTKKD